jgi:hypothetical protein
MSMVRSQKPIGGAVGLASGNAPYSYLIIPTNFVTSFFSERLNPHRLVKKAVRLRLEIFGNRLCLIILTAIAYYGFSYINATKLTIKKARVGRI